MKTRVHKIRLEPNNKQNTVLFKTGGCCRLAYNCMLGYDSMSEYVCYKGVTNAF